MTRGVLKAKKTKETKARKEKEKTKKGKLELKFKELQKSIKNRKSTGLGGAYAARTKKLEKERDTIKLQLDALNRPKTDKKDFSDFGSSLKTKTNRGGDFDKPLKTTKTNRGGDFDKPLTPRKKPVEKSSSNKKSGSVKPINTNSRKEDKGIGEKIVNELKGETRRQQSQLNKPKKTLKPLEQGVRKSGRFTIDSTDEGMSKFMGTDKEIAEQEMEEEMNLRKGGAVAKKYGMREGGFTKRGGMYKKGY